QHLVYSSIRESNSTYVLIPADVYGGEYSVYKGGDPTTTHSMATVRVLQESKVCSGQKYYLQLPSISVSSYYTCTGIGTCTYTHTN
ncbi:hypothetical protein EON63_05535, partial [archaeon]